jgi:hypothetical protein
MNRLTTSHYPLLIMLRWRSSFILAALALPCLGLLPLAQAVIPPPDGGYPGGNTAEGQNALLSLTTGGYNTAVGFFSLRSDMTGQLNTAIGAGTLLANTADNNTATGAAALLSNTIGTQNTANGAFALFSNTEGSFNTATGYSALFSNTTAYHNTATGYQALYSNTTNGGNTANGSRALFSNTIGSYNTANGSFALESNTTGDGNAANGAQALRINTAGSFNTATGFLALYHNTATANTATGYGALAANTTGNENTANGYQALTNNTEGKYNVANGWRALLSNTIGKYNTATGYQALQNNTEGNFNAALGVGAGVAVSTAENVICIGAEVVGENVSNTCYIGNIFGVTSSGGAGVFVNSAGKLGTTTSSRRFKDDIKPMDQASEALFALKPVTFQYKREIDPQGIPQFGLVAEDVEKVNSDLVVRDAKGQIYSVRYDAVNAMLLNEFLKEHRKNEEQQATIAQLKSGMEALIATVKEQAAQIQKVSAQLEASKPAPQVVNNP